MSYADAFQDGALFNLNLLDIKKYWQMDANLIPYWLDMVLRCEELIDS